MTLIPLQLLPCKRNCLTDHKEMGRSCLWTTVHQKERRRKTQVHNVTIFITESKWSQAIQHPCFECSIELRRSSLAYFLKDVHTVATTGKEEAESHNQIPGGLSTLQNKSHVKWWEFENYFLHLAFVSVFLQALIKHYARGRFCHTVRMPTACGEATKLLYLFNLLFPRFFTSFQRRFRWTVLPIIENNHQNNP